MVLLGIRASSYVAIVVTVQFLGVQSLIVPDELPSVLSVVYSNIPTIKKGTDSRLGWGFRLGDRADFQVMVELGPQTNTQPLANQPDKESTSRKRNTVDSFANSLYAKQYRNKQISDTAGGKWLEKWSDSFKYIDGSGQFPNGARPRLSAGEVDAKSVIPPDDQVEEERIKQSLVLRKLQEESQGRSVEDEDALLRFLKLMERIQQQIAEEKKQKQKESVDSTNVSNSLGSPTERVRGDTTTKSINEGKDGHAGVKSNKFRSSIRKSDLPNTNRDRSTDTRVNNLENLTSSSKPVAKSKTEPVSAITSEFPNDKNAPEEVRTVPRINSQVTNDGPKENEKFKESGRSLKRIVEVTTVRSDLPQPTETLWQFILRRLGYYDYLREQRAKEMLREQRKNSTPSKVKQTESSSTTEKVVVVKNQTTIS